MSDSCIACSARLTGPEDAPRILAFDAAGVRLWAVCPRCGRWSLRLWDTEDECMAAISSLDARFAGAAPLHRTKHVECARTEDGTLLVRLGAVRPDEYAAWRYGDLARSRRFRAAEWKTLGFMASLPAVPTLLLSAFWLGYPLNVLSGVGGAALAGMAFREIRKEGRARLIAVPAEASPTGAPLVLGHADIQRAHLVGGGGAPGLLLPQARVGTRGPLTLRGEWARAAILRLAAYRQIHPSDEADLRDALRLRERAGAADLLRDAALIHASLGFGSFHEGRAVLTRQRFLALEMAIWEEMEDAARRGETGVLRRRWADAALLADEPHRNAAVSTA